jgi:hypothetical protein
VGDFDSIASIGLGQITSGCTATAYCPDSNTTRSQMAVFLICPEGPVTHGQMATFLIRGLLGIAAGQSFPYPAQPFFQDVGAGRRYFAFIQKMRERGITGGCTAAEYCADSPTTRGQMAVFLPRGLLAP